MSKFFDWTEARERKVEQLIGQGSTATEIVNAFYVDEGECPTRNAVIGFISRRPKLHEAWIANRPAGAGSRGGTTHLKRGNSANPPGRPSASRRKGGGNSAATIESSGNVVAIAKRRPRLMPKDMQEPAPMMLALEDLGWNQCHWPFGDPQQAGFGFCGHAKLEGSPYCAWHRLRSIAVEFRAEAAE
jgi:GcrA cell cycle regulator